MSHVMAYAMDQFRGSPPFGFGEEVMAIGGHAIVEHLPAANRARPCGRRGGEFAVGVFHLRLKCLGAKGGIVSRMSGQVTGGIENGMSNRPRARFGGFWRFGRHFQKGLFGHRGPLACAVDPKPADKGDGLEKGAPVERDPKGDEFSGCFVASLEEGEVDEGRRRFQQRFRQGLDPCVDRPCDGLYEVGIRDYP